MIDALYPSILPRLVVRLGAALIAALCAFLVARWKNRLPAPWATSCAIAGFAFYPAGAILLLVLLLRPHVSARVKYLSLAMEERFCNSLGIPSPLRNKLEERILVVLVRNPRGLRIGAIGQGVGVEWRSLAELMESLVRSGKVRQREDTYYFNIE